MTKIDLKNHQHLSKEILVVVDGGIKMEKMNMTNQLWNVGNLSDLD